MKNILILENDRYCANLLSRKLKEINQDFQTYEPITSVRNAIAFFTGHTESLPDLPAPDSIELVFADLYLSDGLSFDALKYVKASVPIVFTTTFDDYAMQTFRYNDFEYLLKPVESDNLKQIIERLNSMGKNHTKGFMYHFFDILRKHDFQYRQRFVMEYIGGYQFVWVNEVSHITNERGTNRVWMINGTDFSIGLTAKELDEQLPPEQFFRIDAKSVVNLDRVAFLENHSRNTYAVSMRDYPYLKFLIGKDCSQRLKILLDR